MKAVSLLCFPFAGGSALSFQDWGRTLDSRIKVIPVELKGRGKRINESHYRSMDEVIEDVLNTCINVFTGDEPYILYGHSMGSLIVYELCRTLSLRRLRYPEHVIVSGSSTPILNARRKKLSNLNDEELVEEIIGMGGTPVEVIQHPGFRDYFLPIIRSDFRLIESYNEEMLNYQFECNISIFNGKNDPFINHENIYWLKSSKFNASHRYFDGGHFFIYTNNNELLEEIKTILEWEVIL